MSLAVSQPEPLAVEGREGLRYWVHDRYPFTGDAVVDERLAGFPVAIFQPRTRPASETPLVVALQGMAAPYQWNAFLVPTLLDMGIACALFDTPLAGERSLARRANGNILTEVAPLLDRCPNVGAALIPRLADAVARDFKTVLEIARERHGLRDGRIALFGVSLGVLLAGHAFTRDGIGTRLLGTIGHTDLHRFARSYTPPVGRILLSSRFGRAVGKLAARPFGRTVTAGVSFVLALCELCRGGEFCAAADPMTFAERVTPERRVRFMVGGADRSVNPADAIECARRFPDGACFVVPGLKHGTSQFGPSFVEHVRTFVGTQLGDWAG